MSSTAITWFLVIFFYSGPPANALPDPNYVDKVAVPMTGKMEELCRLEAGVYRYRQKLEGTDYHRTVNVCVPLKQWRP